MAPASPAAAAPSSAILQLPDLRVLKVNSIDVAGYDSSRCPQLTQLELEEATSQLSRLLPLPKLQALVIHWGTPDMAPAISSQTTLTRLEAWCVKGYPDGVIASMVAPLQQLHDLDLGMLGNGGPGGVTSAATMHAIAQLPQLQCLSYTYMQPAHHLWPLIGASQQTRLQVEGYAELETALAALVCKPGLRQVEYAQFGGEPDPRSAAADGRWVWSWRGGAF
jgi:hypothetical protein